MKVLLTTDTVGGIWSYATELARALEPQGVEIVLAAMGGPLSPEQRLAVTCLRHVELCESSFKLEWMDDPWDEVARAGDWLLEIEQRCHPDLIHLNSYAHGSLPWRSPLLIVGHSCVLSWWQAVKGAPAPPRYNRYREAVRLGLHYADRVAAPTAAMLALLHKYYGPLPPAQVVPNGRDPAFFHPGGKGRLVFASGRLWDEAKNIQALEEIAPRLPWPVYVAGENRHPDGGEAIFGHVSFLGRLAISDIAAWNARASIYAHPARYEPFGLGVLEAALSGCALVLGDIPTLRELWDGVARFVFPEDSEALLAQMLELISDRTARHGLGAAARQRALRFTPQRMADAYLALYRTMLPRPLAARPQPVASRPNPVLARQPV